MASTCNPAPTDDEIMAYRNVPVLVAADYLGCSPENVRRPLRSGTAPYGYAVLNEEKGSYSFQISPGALVGFRNGTLAKSVEEAPEVPVGDIIARILASMADAIKNNQEWR